jgi:hypothetical protein
VPPAVALGAEHLKFELRAFRRRQLKILISDDRTRAITNNVFLKCIASTNRRSEGAFRNRRSAYMQKLFARKGRSRIRDFRKENDGESRESRLSRCSHTRMCVGEKIG